MEWAHWLQAFSPIFVAVMASGGFWAVWSKRQERNNAQTQLLIGLAHDRIIHVGMAYIERGWITKDEYDDFIQYLYRPYMAFNVNGLAEKVMEEMSKLPFHKEKPIESMRDIYGKHE